MNFTINSTELLKSISNLNRNISKNPIIPILKNFLFEIIKEDLIITASDLKTFTTVKIKIKSKDNLKILIPSKILIETIKNLKNQEIKFLINEKKKILTIKSENGVYKIKCEDEKNFPKINLELNNNFFTKIPALIFKKIINYLIFASSNNELKKNINGIYINFNKINTIFVSTDGYRLVKYIRKDIKSNCIKSIIIDKKSILLISSIINNFKEDININIINNNIYFNIKNYKIISQLTNEEYPDYENVIPKKKFNKLKINRLKILNSLKRISTYSNQILSLIKIKITKEKIDIFTEDNEFFNSANEEIQCKYSGEDIYIGFNSKLLIELINNINSIDIEINISNSNEACIIKPKENKEEELILLIMPIIID